MARAPKPAAAAPKSAATPPAAPAVEGAATTSPPADQAAGAAAAETGAADQSQTSSGDAAPRELGAESTGDAAPREYGAASAAAADLVGEINDPVFAAALAAFIAAGEQTVAAYQLLATAAEGKPPAVLLMQEQRLSEASRAGREAEYAAHERLIQIYSLADEAEGDIVTLKVKTRDGKSMRRAGFTWSGDFQEVTVDPVRAERLRTDPNLVVQQVGA